MPVFRHLCELDHPSEEVYAWHTRPGALHRLIPPWESIRVHASEHRRSVGGRVRLGVQRGPAELIWEVEHTRCEADRLLVDEQVSGPFESWRYEQRFVPIEGDRTVLEASVHWDPPLGSLGQSLSERYVHRVLHRVLSFRARRLRGDLRLLRRYGGGRGRVVAITGSTGLIGTALCHLLEVTGYRVLRISRSESLARGWVQWDPAKGKLPRRELEGLFAVIHLAGESIAGVRWTAAKKDAILESREQGTRLLCRTLAELDHPPEILISSSAVGYYGHRGNEPIAEDGDPGTGFLAEVCKRWEASTHAAAAIGIRTVVLRGGLVLSPAGGPLGMMLLPFTMGLGGRIGSGRQYLSWIDLDDYTGMILHAMGESDVRGVLNATSPNPVTNAAFTDVLGRVLRRPTLLPVPALAMSALLGEMGVELLLSGQRVVPEKAIRSGYEFLFSDLEDSLRHQLGREEDHRE